MSESVIEPAIDTGDGPVVESRRSARGACAITWGALLALTGAVIAFVCMFLPMVTDAGGHLVRPVEFAVATWPHVMGLFAATGVVLALVDDRSGAAFVAMSLHVMVATVAVGSAVFLYRRAPASATAMLVVASIALVGVRGKARVLARALWLLGLLGLVALSWLGSVGEPAPGLWLSGSGALLLIVGGSRFERGARRGRDSSALPRAALVRTSAHS